MSMGILSLILGSVIISVIAQILLKAGMSAPAVQDSLSRGPMDAVWAVLTSYAVLGGLFAYVSSAALWLVVLSQVDVSKAYPFVGLGFIGTMLFAHWFLNEPMNISKIFGTLFIVTGILLISKN